MNSTEAQVKVRRPIAPLPVSKSSLGRIEDAVRAAMARVFSLQLDEITARLLVLSSDYSELASGVGTYAPQQTPEDLESARLTLTTQSSSLIVELTVSPTQQGTIQVSYENRNDDLDLRVRGILDFVGELLRENAHSVALAQPNTTTIRRRLPSCRLDARNLWRLKEIADSELKEFMRGGVPVLESVSVEGNGPEGRFTADSLRDLPDVRGMKSIEVLISQTEKYRSVDLIISIRPVEWENTIVMSFSAFDSPESLRDVGHVLGRVVDRIAARRTFHGWLYFSPMTALGLWGVCSAVLIGLVGEFDASALALVLPLALPVGVVLAQRQFPYIVLEPARRGLVERLIAVVVPIVVAAFILPWLISWLAGTS